MRVVRARILALLLALSMLLPSGAMARAQYYCPMMGVIVAACCDDAVSVAEAPSATQQLRSADCCQRLSASNRGVSLGTREALGGVALATLLTTVTVPLELASASDAESTCGESTQAPLAIGPPLFVMHCALLS